MSWKGQIVKNRATSVVLHSAPMSAGIRKPGQEFVLTDEELLAAPAKLLSPNQRKRRRKLRADTAQKRRREARNKRMETGIGKLIYCQGFRKDGEPCHGYAVNGAKHCIIHLNEAEQKKLGKVTLQQAGRLKATTVKGSVQTAPQTARQVMEVAVEKLLQRYFRAVGLEFQGFDEDGVPVVFDHGVESGLRLHGESKDGYIEMSKYPDLMAQIQVIEKIWDRVYGRPKQTQVLEGGTKPVQIQPVRTADRAKRVGALLHQVGAIPHEGRHRPESSTGPNTPDGESPADPDNVVPLHDSDG